MSTDIAKYSIELFKPGGEHRDLPLFGRGDATHVALLQLMTRVLQSTAPTEQDAHSVLSWASARASRGAPA
jgi:hypothetical protein